MSQMSRNRKGKKKVWLIVVIMVILVFAAVASQGYNIYMGTFTLGRTTVITTEPGEVIDEGTSFTKYGKLDAVQSHKGTVERLDYTTDVYENGITYNKYVNVYLPYGYDQNDTSKKYNVLYFQHGNTMDPNIFVSSSPKKWMDNLFASEGIRDDIILVFTTYYMNPERDKTERLKSGFVEAGDGNWNGLPGNFWKEVVEDILPLVESRYNTYTESFDADGLKASRDHRGFSGYSRGSVCTWYMFRNAFEYFKWYAPMSCHCVAGKSISDEVTSMDAYHYLKETIDAHSDLDFFIYAASGNPQDAPKMREQIAFFEKQTDTFSYGNDPKENNLFYTLSDFRHSDLFVPYYYYNSLQVLFSE